MMFDANQTDGQPAGGAQAAMAGHQRDVAVPLAHDTPDPATRFSLARVVQGVALVVLLGAITRALMAFSSLAVALPIAVVLTWGFATATHTVFSPGHWAARSAAAALAIVLGCVTTSLSFSSFYITTSAPESARRDYEAKRERTQRELQRLVSAADSARQAIADWSAVAATKSKDEANGGNTCPTRPTNGVPGPISTWRADDSRVAANLATELQAKVDVAQAAVAEVLALAPTDDFSQVKTGYATLNRAIDAVAPLSKGGWSGSALATLSDRRSSQIVYPGGVTLSCGDGGRLSLIDRAGLELKKLDDTAALARLVPAVDLSRPQDVVTRGLVRGMNLMLRLLSFGYLGQFKDDPLMEDALKVGAFTAESTPFLLSILAELSVVVTSVFSRQAGSAPFALNLPDWVRAQQRRNPRPGPAMALVRAVATLLSNLLYGRQAAVAGQAAHLAGHDAGGQPAGGIESEQFSIVTLPDDPSFRERETRWARELLLPYYHSWGDEEDYLVQCFVLFAA